MTKPRKRTIEETCFLQFPAFKDIVANDFEDIEFSDKVAQKMKLKQIFAGNNFESLWCKCLMPTEKELKNALKNYHSAKQKSQKADDEGEQSENLPPQTKISFNIPRKPVPEKTAKLQVQVNTTANLGFSSARDECLRQAAEKNRPPPAGISWKASVAANQPARRYMGNRLVTLKPKTSPNLEEMICNSKVESKECEDERLQGIEEKLLERIKMDVLAKPSSLTWDDIKGLDFAKQTMMEAIVYPIQRPDLFTGLRRPPKGVLMFGPPGTGKTLIAKCVANNANATFFNISASTLTSKWIGEGEKMVRALFTYACVCQPSVIFIDEVDSLLSQRSDSEHESSRRLKTEFLCFLDGCGTDDNDQVLLIGATNRPYELDEAARRRFTKRLYIPLPEKEARINIFQYHLNGIQHSLKQTEIECLAEKTEGFSGADIKVVAETAGMMPMRDLIKKLGFFSDIKKEDIPAVTLEHFNRALTGTRPSVTQEDLIHYLEWNKKFGSTDGF